MGGRPVQAEWVACRSGFGHAARVGAVAAACLAGCLAGCGAPQGRRSADTADAAGAAGRSDSAFRVGVVHMERVLATSVTGRAAQQQLEAEVNELNARMGAARQAVEAAAEAVDEARKRRVPRRRMERLAADYEQAFARSKQLEGQLRAEYEQQQKLATGPVVASVKDIAARLGEREGLSLIVEARAVPFFGQQSDLTDRVIAELDEATARAEIAAELTDDPGEAAAGDGAAPASESQE